MYQLEYWANGRLKEVVLWAAPLQVCHWKARQLKGSHKLGIFKIKKK